MPTEPLPSFDNIVYDPTPQEINNEIHHPFIGIVTEQSANVGTGIRAIGGLAFYRYIEATPDYQSWKTFGMFVLLAVTDGEGMLSRIGRKWQGKDENTRRPFNSYADLLADKIFINGIMLAIAKREEANGNILYAKAAQTTSAITVSRDILTTADRIVADCQKLDTRAQNAGKKKALLQYIIVGLSLTPFAKNDLVKTALEVAFLYTAKKSVSSGISLHQSFTGQRQQKRMTKTLPPYTSPELF